MTNDTVGCLYAKLHKKIASAYKEDPTNPGLTTSRSHGKTYASIVRFKKPFGKEKFTEMSAYNKRTRGALRALIRKLDDQLAQETA